MITEYAAKYAAKKLFDIALDQIKRKLNEASRQPHSSVSPEMLITTSKDMQEALSYHLNLVNNWSSEVLFKDLRKPKQVTEVYVELETLVFPKRQMLDSKELNKSILLTQIFKENDGHIIVLGDPGAGKTTSMKFLCQLLLQGEDDLCDQFTFPLVVRFRELNNQSFEKGSTPLTDSISNILNINIDWKDFGEGEKTESGKSSFGSKQRKIQEMIVITMLEELRPLLVLDGFDELASKENRDVVINEIRN